MFLLLRESVHLKNREKRKILITPNGFEIVTKLNNNTLWRFENIIILDRLTNNLVKSNENVLLSGTSNQEF